MDALDQVPCPTLVTDAFGRVLATNADLLALVGGTTEQWLQRPIEELLPPASRIFLQTHVWPILLRDGHAREIHLKICDAQSHRVPIMVNCRKGVFAGNESYYWVFFVAEERSQFEAEVLNARNRAEASARALAESEHFIKTIADGLPGLVAYWDKNLVCRFANKNYLDWFGKVPAAVIGTTMKDLLGERLFALNEPHIISALKGEEQVFERTLTKFDGSIGYTLAHYIPDTSADGEVKGIFVLVSDVTQIKTAEVELRLASSIVQSAVEGIMVTDAEGIILSVNPAFTKITGYSTEQAVGQTPQFLRSNHHDEAFYVALRQELADRGRWEGETWNRRQDGDVFRQWQTVTVIRSLHNEPLRYVSIFNDITERWRKDERVKHLALHDALTDLPNRILFTERLGQLITMIEREKRNVAVMFLDLDRFKIVNDTFGHDVGDTLLKEVAPKLQAQIRHSDTVARLGGDEFVILLDNPASKAEVAHIADRIVRVVKEPIVIRAHPVQVGTSIGIALHPADGSTPEQLIKSADIAMFAAKESGKNSFRFYEPTMIARQNDKGGLVAK